MNLLVKSLFLYVLLENLRAETFIIVCIGDSVQYNCTVKAMAHTWIIPAFNINISISHQDTAPLSVGPFTFRTMADDGNLITSLSMIATTELNNTEVSCMDSSNQLSLGDMQSTTFVTYGDFTAPGLTVVAVDLVTLSFTIFPLSEPSQCVVSYEISLISSDDSMMTVTALAPDTEVPIVITRSGFDFCEHTYSFTAKAVALNSTVESSPVVKPSVMDIFSPLLTVENSEFIINITAVVPIISAVDFQHSSPQSLACDHEVRFFNRLLEGNTISATETLDCGYAGRAVTYCLQYSNDTCQSLPTMERIALLPSLISTQPVVLSATSENITIMVDVDELSSCDGVNELSVRAFISNGAQVMSTKLSNFTDTTIMFTSLSPGVYNCSVSIFDRSGPIETRVIPCGTSYECEIPMQQQGGSGVSTQAEETQASNEETDEEGCSSATLIVVSMMCSLFAFAGGLIVAALIVRMYYVKTHNKYMAIQPTAEFGSN